MPFDIDDSVKPALEWINGKLIQKHAPYSDHAFVQTALARLIYHWAKHNTDQRGRVGIEWRFVLPPNSDDTRSLVPDVAYLADYLDLPAAHRQYPTVPPTIAVEVRSAGERDDAIATKCDAYLRWGVRLIVIADPARREATIIERGKPQRMLADSEVIQATEFPGLAIGLDEVFAELCAID